VLGQQQQPIKGIASRAVSVAERRNVTSRLMRGMAAAGLGPIVTAAIQLGSVPLLLHAWGPSKYGDWLLLSAVPSYLSFSGLGFGDSSGSDMTMRVAGSDREGALATFQSSWVLLSGMSLAVLAVAATLVWFVPWKQMLHLAGITKQEAAWIVLVLAGWILAMQQWSILESGYRCDGNFALGNFCSTMQRLLEAAGSTIIGVFTGSLLLMSLSYLSFRLAGLLCYGLLLKRLRPWLHLGFGHASVTVVRKMLKPSLGFIAMPMGTAVSIQGFMLLVGIVLGPIAVTAFSTARTLARVGVQLINSLGGGIWPEFSSAFGAGNLSLARRLHRRAYQASLILALSCAGFLWLIGPRLYHVWVRDSVALGLPLFHILLLVSIASSLWFPSAIVQMSANTHSRLASTYLLVTVVSCGVGYMLTRKLGLMGAAVALLLVDIVMCTFVLPRSLRQMQDTPREFFRAVFGSAPYFVKPLLATYSLRR
jgi:O-antigen/teichoic acid export membrane protein